jgi:hypothetical protein
VSADLRGAPKTAGFFQRRRTILIAQLRGDDRDWFCVPEKELSMTYEYDFEMVKRAYAEMARRAREKDEVRRLPRNGMPATTAPVRPEELDRQSSPA